MKIISLITIILTSFAAHSYAQNCRMVLTPNQYTQDHGITKFTYKSLNHNKRHGFFWEQISVDVSSKDLNRLAAAIAKLGIVEGDAGILMGKYLAGLKSWKPEDLTDQFIQTLDLTHEMGSDIDSTFSLVDSFASKYKIFAGFLTSRWGTDLGPRPPVYRTPTHLEVIAVLKDALSKEYNLEQLQKTLILIGNSYFSDHKTVELKEVYDLVQQLK